MNLGTPDLAATAPGRSSSWSIRGAGGFRLLAATFLVVAASGDSARAAAPLRWKFKPGEVLHYTMKQKTSNTFKPKPIREGAEASTRMTQVVDLHWTVKSVSPEGDAELTQVVDRVRTRIEGAGQPAAFEFDSDAKEAPKEGLIAAQLVPLLRTLVGAEFTFKMSADGKLSDIKIPEKLMETVRKADPAAGDGSFSDEGIKNLVTQTGLALPDAALEQGRTWKDQSKITLPMMLGTLVMDKTYTLLGPDQAERGRVKIGLDAKVTVQPSAEAGVAMKIDIQEGKGVFSFDAERGRVVSSRVDELLVMSLTDKVAQDREIEQTTKTQTEMTLNPEVAAK